MSEGYNGWTNYETWLVALWIDNEQGSYNRRQEMAIASASDSKCSKLSAQQILARELEELK